MFCAHTVANRATSASVRVLISRHSASGDN